MAHEGLTAVLLILGSILLLGFYFGPRNEVRKVKRTEGMIMLVPTGVLMMIIAAIVFSGILDGAP